MVSPWGQEIRENTVRLIAQELPIGVQTRGFRGNVGAMATRSASVSVLVADGGYFGDAPLGLQDTVVAPDPWNRV